MQVGKIEFTDPNFAPNQKADILSIKNALEFYELNGRNCRKVHSEGEVARKNLDKDGGELARKAFESLMRFL